MAKYLVAPAMFAGEIVMSNFLVVSHKQSVLDEDGNAVEAIVGYQGGSEKIYYAEVAGMFDAYEAGDIVYIVSNKKGSVSRIYPTYDRSANQITASDGYHLHEGLWCQRRCL